MASFYSRYIPPTPPSSKNVTKPSITLQNASASPAVPETSSSSRSKSKPKDVAPSEVSALSAISTFSSKTKKSYDAHSYKNILNGQASEDNCSTNSKLPSSKAGSTKGHTKQADIAPQSHEAYGSATNPIAERGDSSTALTRKRRHGGATEVADTDRPAKHAKVLSKYDKSTNKEPGHSASGSIVEQEKEEETHTYGLAPLPQPPAPAPAELPSYATLPEWLAHPLIVSSHTRNFSDLGLSEKLLNVLASQGYTQAMPIQSAVIPLALNRQHRGDICISAATGSGKTLSYVLPLISTIKPLPISQLRALVVVPTRELVKQARKAFESCASGTGLQIGTAVGSTPLKDEQSLLMDRDEIYDPYARKPKTEVTTDWLNFKLEDYLSQIQENHKSLPNHIFHTFPAVDILICTPGRLVDHIQSTKGFDLTALQWLVIDEADRLLNESFQEWTSVVIPAMQRTPPSLTNLDHFSTRKLPRKIILSATMTRDINKLSSLRLTNPKLVELRETALESPEETALGAHSERYQLPPTLTERFIPVGDGADKPLFLLQVLESRLKDQDQDAESSDSSSTDSDSEGSSRKTTPSVLIFTKSTESALRLARLIELLVPTLASSMGVLVKSNNSSTSRKTLAAYHQGKVKVIVATDRASRGLDLPSLDHVISYDIPLSVTSYIHRVGRTARAGRRGTASTLVTHSEGRWFSHEIVKGAVDRGSRSVQRMVVNLSDDIDLRERYNSSLQQLGEEVVDTPRK